MPKVKPVHRGKTGAEQFHTVSSDRREFRDATGWQECPAAFAMLRQLAQLSPQSVQGIVSR
ncbi:MAG: hypothetical protein MZV49_10855 [Rhodopseudomonas palustris]|nr:hypothetical protein [Rhodopseudomonas palustris]